MRVLVVNAGSSSMKCQLIDTTEGTSLLKITAERIGGGDAFMTVAYAPDFVKTRHELGDKDHRATLKYITEVITTDEASPIKSLAEIDAIGNRIVAGGEYFSASALVDETTIPDLKKCEELAPLHNPYADECIFMMRDLLPETPQVCVFDTAFHMTMPPKAFMYPLPKRYYDEYKIRRYGAHGTSHRYAAQQAALMLGRPLEELDIITCHIGNGGSITAVHHGESIDTSMGFTPLDGLMMGTRCGSIDPAIIPFIMRREDIDYDGIDNLMNKKSGVLGISGLSSDMRDVETAAGEGNADCQLALDMYIYRIQKTIGSFLAILPHPDAIVMTAGVGENSAEIRDAVFSPMKHLGIYIDNERNYSKQNIISTDDSPIKLCVVAADEEMRIAQETDEIVSAL